jgi:sialate O-acetylesterase
MNIMIQRLLIVTQFEFLYFSRRTQRSGDAAVNRSVRCFAANAARTFCKFYTPKNPNWYTTRLLHIIIVILALSGLQNAYSQVRLPRLVRDSMVLQRDMTVKIWGWAGKGEKVNIKFNNKNHKTTTGADGKWTVVLPPMKAGGPYTMDITGRNKITLNNILIGDVWICAGQSNMVHQMELHKERYAEDIATANYPEIRHFFIPTLTDLQILHDDLPAGYWKPATPQDIRQFSVVAYFFAKTIYDKYHVPIGLINASVGGTPIEAWISEEGLMKFPAISNTIQKNKDTAYINNITRTAFATNARRPKQQDKGLIGSQKWYDTSYVPKGWRTINIPGYWEEQGIKDLDGIVWYRKEINVPASMTGIPAKMRMGRIVDADFVYINGTLVGNTTYQYPQRRYELPAGLLKPGKNTIVIRVINNFGKGGFVPDKPYYISAGSHSIDLKGDWQYKVGDAFVPFQGAGGISLQGQPTALFNAMVAPLVNYAMKGILWYQGEANSSRAKEYAELLPALIADWRQQWKQPDAPFLYVQLPNYMETSYLPSESQWAALREAQLKTLSVPRTGMAVAIDLGEWNDIHPGNKKDVGLRLALAAKKIAYGENDIVYSGPVYKSFTIQDNKIRIAFTNTGSGLVSNDGEPLSQFAIAGADKKFVWAKAHIEGDNVIVWNENVANPQFVRYAWADNPENPNLYNKEGLPASPFRTDQ